MTRRITPRRYLGTFTALTLVGVLALVWNADYYRQAITGHAQMMLARVAIDDLVEQPDVDPALREQLGLASRIREFATAELTLPDNDSYRHYASLERDHAVWTVTALPEFSLSPKEWCYPIVGCQTYRGYFDEERARAMAQQLRNQGYEVVVGGTSAYSTLGFFDDPITDVMLARSDAALADLLFHELAHQRLFVRGDTMFNEGYANFVGEQGVREWLGARGESVKLQRWQARREQTQVFRDLLLETRDRLDALYASSISPEAMREQKADILGDTRMVFDQQLVANHPGLARFRSWFDEPVTNARLARVATYRKWMPAFRTLYEMHDGDWAAFHHAVEELAELPRAARDERLRSYMAEPPTAL